MAASINRAVLLWSNRALYLCALLFLSIVDCHALQEQHQDLLQGYQVATMQALLEQQVVPGTMAVLAATSGDPQDISAAGKDMVVPKVLVPLVKVSDGDSLAAEVPRSDHF